MNEKAYKTMSLAGAAGITVGIIVMVTGSGCWNYLHCQRSKVIKRQKRTYVLKSDKIRG